MGGTGWGAHLHLALAAHVAGAAQASRLGVRSSARGRLPDGSTAAQIRRGIGDLERRVLGRDGAQRLAWRGRCDGGLEGLQPVVRSGDSSGGSGSSSSLGDVHRVRLGAVLLLARGRIVAAVAVGGGWRWWRVGRHSATCSSAVVCRFCPKTATATPNSQVPIPPPNSTDALTRRAAARGCCRRCLLLLSPPRLHSG